MEPADGVRRRRRRTKLGALFTASTRSKSDNDIGFLVVVVVVVVVTPLKYLPKRAIIFDKLGEHSKEPSPRCKY